MKTEIPQWIMRYKDEPSHGFGCEAVETLLSIIETLEKEIEILRSGKPDWKDAPEWAEWLAMDAGGSWWWYECKPYLNASNTSWIDQIGIYLPLRANYTQRINENFETSLEKRPTHEKE